MSEVDEKVKTHFKNLLEWLCDCGTYRLISILEASTHLWLRMKLEALDWGPEDWICMAPNSLLAATSPFLAELQLPNQPHSLLLPYQSFPSLALPSQSLVSSSFLSGKGKVNLSSFLPTYQTAFFIIQSSVTATSSDPPPPLLKASISGCFLA